MLSPSQVAVQKIALLKITEAKKIFWIRAGRKNGETMASETNKPGSKKFTPATTKSAVASQTPAKKQKQNPIRILLSAKFSPSIIPSFLDRKSTRLNSSH